MIVSEKEKIVSQKVKQILDLQNIEPKLDNYVMLACIKIAERQLGYKIDNDLHKFLVV